MADPCCDNCGATVKITSQVISGIPDPNSQAGPAGPPGPAGPQGSPILIRALTQQGLFTEPLMLLRTDAETTILKVIAVVTGPQGSSATFNIYQHATANGPGTAIFPQAITASSMATGHVYPDEQAFVADPLIIPEGNFLWLETSATTGPLETLFVQISYKQACEPCV